MIGEAKGVLPDAKLTRDQIITSFAGLRPLVSESGAPARVSRKHVIRESYSGLIYVMGGKYTTYRKIAEDTVRRLTKKPLVETREEFPVYGSGDVEGNIDVLNQKYDVPADVIRSLIGFYGSRYCDVLKLVEENPSLKAPICSCSTVIRAQIVYAIRTEMARTEDDIVIRRLVLGYDECPTGECRKAIRAIVSEEKL